MKPWQIRKLAREKRRQERQARREAREQRRVARLARIVVKPRTRFWGLPYKMGSESCALLIRLINGKQIKPEGSKYVQRNSDVVINWGSSHIHPRFVVHYNQPDRVAVATSKMATFSVLGKAGIPIPEWTRNHADAESWFNTKHKVVGRQTDTGKAGAGITVYKPGDKIGNHLFYTRYFKKDREFRINVFGGKFIWSKEKK